jgi:ABC-type transporter Mla subunit MlaD
MKIDRGFEFTRDTIASILTSGLLGEVYIGLDSGGDTQMLADGARIPKTQSAMVLEKLIGQFMFDKAASGGNGAAAPATGASASGSGASPPPAGGVPGTAISAGGGK